LWAHQQQNGHLRDEALKQHSIFETNIQIKEQIIIDITNQLDNLKKEHQELREKLMDLQVMNLI